MARFQYFSLCSYFHARYRLFSAFLHIFFHNGNFVLNAYCEYSAYIYRYIRVYTVDRMLYRKMYTIFLKPSDLQENRSISCPLVPVDVVPHFVYICFDSQKN